MRPHVYLSADERLRVYQLHREGRSQAEFARHASAAWMEGGRRMEAATLRVHGRRHLSA